MPCEPCDPELLAALFRAFAVGTGLDGGDGSRSMRAKRLMHEYGEVPFRATRRLPGPTLTEAAAGGTEHRLNKRNPQR
eukprot:13436975-Alexandrium_andersonii.AAC.1